MHGQIHRQVALAFEAEHKLEQPPNYSTLQQEGVPAADGPVLLDLGGNGAVEAGGKLRIRGQGGEEPLECIEFRER